MLVTEAATLSYRASYRRVPKNLSKSLNSKVSIKTKPLCCPKIKVVREFCCFIPLKTTTFCFSYSPRTIALKVLLRKLAWLTMLL